MGDGLGELFKTLVVLSIIGIVSVLGGVIYGLIKLVGWIF